MAAAADSTFLDHDDTRNPRSLCLFATLVEAESRRYATRTASLPSENDLIRGFCGGATPSIVVGDFLECVQRYLHCEGSIFVLATVYLTRFIRSHAARDATWGSSLSRQWRTTSSLWPFSSEYTPNSPRVFPICSDESINAKELSALEVSFLRTIDYLLFVTDVEFERFCGHLERGPKASESCGGRKRKVVTAGRVEEPRSVRPCQLPVMAS